MGRDAKTLLSPKGIVERFRAVLTDSSHQSIAQRVAGTAFVIRVMSAAIAYVSQVLMARWMGSNEFGTYISVWVWVLLLGHISNAGLASAAQRFIPEYGEKADQDGLRGFIAGSRIIGVLAATIVAGLGLLVLWRFGHLVAQPMLMPLVLAAICLPLYVLTDIQDGIARSYNWTDLALGPPYLIRPVLLLAGMVVGYGLGLVADAVTAMACAVIATWTTAIIQFWLIQRRLAGQVPAGPKRVEAGFWLRTSAAIFLVEAFYMALTYTDVILLKQLSSAEEVAIYWAAVKTLALVAFIYFSVAAAAAHRFSEYHVAGDREKLAAFLQASIRWTFFPSLAATILILALGKPFLMLFGPDFVKGYPAMFVVSAGLLARAAVGPVERLLSMSGHQGVCALIYGAAFATAVILCLVLIPRFGMMGAATATAIALTLESVLLFWITRRRLGLAVSFWAKHRPVSAA
ncbi:lipopolysaccharide biosynthesis protein [Phreatobacter stygius]|uniref:Lipopolysaccharide biosynthesis protein n=1 Tax=Phreatobacter stygius TaxID=1940610 RepID=A0A4D7B8E3_9HYPH|nr:lipopolysaccharide biosynthesis protein [Phreatobacter stygius]QCI64372.1 lipopolysaccharide biosynthesis protein [Phreatobacter stygius]